MSNLFSIFSTNWKRIRFWDINYRDINLYFVYDKVYKQWFTSGTKFFNEAVSEKVKNPNFKLIEFMKKFYYTEEKVMVMLLVLINRDKA